METQNWSYTIHIIHGKIVKLQIAITSLIVISKKLKHQGHNRGYIRSIT